MAILKVHGTVRSQGAMRVFACLNEKQLQFEFIPVNMSAGDHKKEPFISLNPFGQVPAFEDGDLKLFESRAITNYITHEYAQSGAHLIPMDKKKKAIVVVWMDVEAHQFDPPSSKLTWELCFKPMYGMATDGAVVEDNESKLGKVLDVYEARLAQCKYLAGDDFSLADLHHIPNMHYLMATPIKKVFLSRPLVSAWCANIMARPGWIKVRDMLIKD